MHENFDILNSLPINNNEGILSEHIRWLKRGTVKIFENKKCLFIGGAESLDKDRRIEHLSWWKEESIAEEDIKSIEKDNYDYVFTHCAPRSTLDEYLYLLADFIFDQDAISHNSEDKLELIKNSVTFDQWWFGHYHKNLRLDDNFMCLFDRWEVLK